MQPEHMLAIIAAVAIFFAFQWGMAIGRAKGHRGIVGNEAYRSIFRDSPMRTGGINEGPPPPRPELPVR